MTCEELERLIGDGLPGAEVRVTGDGSHFEAVVVSALFEGRTMVQEQKMVYATLGDRIARGEVHALSIKAHTPAEWEKARRLRIQ